MSFLPFRTGAAVLVGLLFGHATLGQLNITQLGHYDYQAARGSDLSNIWGYADELGNEYALVGVNGENGNNNTGGLSIVDVTDPANPVEVFFTNGPNSIWREIKVYGDHAYMTTEAEQGLTIVDLSPLPQSNVLPTTVFQGDNWITSHSLFIDETNGRLYLNGSNRGNGGSIMYDLTQDPMSPVEIGEFDNWYVHDCYARGDLFYGAHIYDGFFSIVDVSDPASPVLLGTQTTPNNFTHNCWLDDTGDFIFTTDETEDSKLAAYDISDPSDIQFLDQLQTAPGTNAIIHNTYWLHDHVVQSYYREGVSVYDVQNPGNIVEVGHFDTSPLSGGGFIGAWGVYPFAPSGRLYVSDIEEGLFILGPTYVEACFLQGNITDQQNGNPVANATVSIQGTTANDLTGFDGSYATGYAVPGTYIVTVSAPGYLSATVEGVVLVNGEITLQDIQLVPLVSFTFSGTVIEQGSGSPVPDAIVQVVNPTYQFEVLTNAAGQFTIPGVFTDTYDITVGKWGYHTVCAPDELLVPGAPAPVYELPVGYADDFALDLGWTTSENAGSGFWVRGVPVGTVFGNGPSAPGEDVANDCGEQAYITGNGGGQAGNDDVDDGSVTLLSPVFDGTLTNDMWITYYRWWFNDGGNGDMNDELVISLTNGTETATVETVDDSVAPEAQWVLYQSPIAGLVTPTSTMRLQVTTADQDPGHLVEAGLDRFEVLLASPFQGLAQHMTKDLAVWPVPSEGHISLSVPLAGTVRFFDIEGREVVAPQRVIPGVNTVELRLASGLYSLRYLAADGVTTSNARLVVR